MPSLLAPLALFGLASLPALAAIYWLRNRYRRRTVSSLMLWAELSQAREGGTRIQRLQTPLLFLLELLALLLLVAAAVGPRMLLTSTRLPLIVVLDDSYSMQAPGSGSVASGEANESARDEAIKAIEHELDGGYYTVRFILAGAQPQTIGEPTASTAAAKATLKQWHCESSTADLAAATALAGQIGGDVARVLVVTDHEPATKPSGGKVQWWAFGHASTNAAFVNASRAVEPGRSGGDRAMFEVANFSKKPGHVPMTVADDKGKAISHATLDLAADEVRSVFFDLDPGTQTVHATLGDDALATDNAVTLEPVSRPAVRVATSIEDETLRRRVQRALEAIPAAKLVTDDVQLWITDRPTGTAAESDLQRWAMQIMREDPAQAYLGPFVVDRAHPLTDGLSLTGVIWAAGETDAMPGRPVITAGNVELVSDQTLATGRHIIRMRLREDLSSLLDSPNWPIFMWNLVTWRGQHLPGLERTNVRVGENAVVAVAPSVTHSTTMIHVTDPAGKTHDLAAASDRVSIPAEAAGVYYVQVGAAKYAFAANVLDHDESDLSAAAAGRFGDWAKAPAFRWEYQSVAWVFALAAAAALTLHMWFVSRASREGVRTL